MVCKKCGFTQDTNAVFCSNCGENLRETEIVENLIENTNENTNENQVETNNETDVAAEVKQEIEAEINTLSSETPVIESLNDTQAEKTQAEKTEVEKTEDTQSLGTAPTLGEAPNVAPAPKSNATKSVGIVLVGLIGVLVIGVIIVVAMMFMKPSAGRAFLKTQSQMSKELEAANKSNVIAADIKKINEGSFILSYNMDNILSTNGILTGDAKNTTISGEYDSAAETFAYYVSSEVSNQQIMLNLLTMTAPGYKETYVKGTEENYKQFVSDITNLFSEVATTKGVKLDDEKYDYEYKFNVDAYALVNATIEYSERQQKLQNDFLTTLELNLQPLNTEDVGKLFTGVTGQPTNFMIDYYIQSYNEQLETVNAEISSYIDMYSSQYEESLDLAVSEFDIEEGEIFEVTMKTTDGVITYVELTDAIDTIVLEAKNFTSYLQSDYTFYVVGENQLEPIDFTVNITPERWNVGVTAAGSSLEFDWDLVATEDNLSLAVQDAYYGTNETVKGSLTGDYENGITLDMKDFGKIIFQAKK